MDCKNDKYQNRYRIPSTRLQKWDYGWNAIYFVTICTKDRQHYFGEITDGKMHLSPVGAIADVLWHELKNHFNNIELDAFVVMPNHIHGIIAINNVDNVDNGTTIDGTIDGSTDGITGGSTVGSTVETTHALSLPSPSPSPSPLSQPPKTIGQQRFQHQGSKTLSSIVGSYKSAVSRHAHRLGYDFSWQSRFYDIIVRNNSALINIQSYICDNPINWKEDKFFKQ